MERKFRFQSLSEEEVQQKCLFGGSLICWVRGPGDSKMEQELVLAYGRMLALFGPPLYIDPDLENQYRYCIEAKDDQGSIVYLDVYSGPSGPAIGGDPEGDIEREAAEELAALILSTGPEDYDYVGYYLDGPCKVHMGIKNGQPFIEESELTDEEFRKILG